MQEMSDYAKEELRKSYPDMTGSAMAEMPRYKCHKTVWALQIQDIVKGSDGGALIPMESGFAPIRVSREYFEKHNPHAGGYYVVYADGYKSFSPAQAFEEGYTKL